MMIKEILVHLDGSTDDESRIVQAEHLAVVHKSHLQGLFINLLPDPPLSVSHYPVSRGLLAEHLLEAEARRGLVEHALELRFNRVAVPRDLARFDCLAAQAGGVAATQARLADLLVVRTPYRVAQPNRASDVVEAALFGSGRAVFVIPEADPLHIRPLDTVVIAWKNSPQAANAVMHALPFLRQADQVVIVTADPGGSAPARTGKPGADVARYLRHHDVNAEVRHLGKRDNVAAALFNEAELLGAGLIVAGAYGHSRLREWALGGVTRNILTKTPVPALLAH
ncbi:MAG: universal stress protein [Azospirillaceae bacterium]|nr:universal stress protein [Azospirillaceae bacterium]